MKKFFLPLAILLFTQAVPPHPSLTWCAIGDSITYLNDHADETGGRVSTGYLSRVKAALPYISYSNQGHNGWTSGGIAAAIDTLKLTKADVYSVFLGTNDWWQGRPLGSMDEYRTNAGNNTVFGSFRIIINKIRRLNPAAKIILVTPMQRTDFVYINGSKNNAWGCYRDKNGQSLKSFADAVVTIAEYEHAAIINLYDKKGMDISRLVKFKRLKDPQTGQYRDYHYPAYTTIPFNPATDAYPYPPEAMDITFDGLHPSDKGNQLIADLFTEILQRY
jgi:lysophospholipase L1-like esterase